MRKNPYESVSCGKNIIKPILLFRTMDLWCCIMSKGIQGNLDNWTAFELGQEKGGQISKVVTLSRRFKDRGHLRRENERKRDLCIVSLLLFNRY